MNQPATPPVAIRRGVVAVICRGEQLLVIRRSQKVTAPGAFCFPGGGIELGETEEEALMREMREELGVDVTPLRQLWRHTTGWGVDLSWWLTDLPDNAQVLPNADEVASVHWHNTSEMAGLEPLLDSNRRFLAALASGEFSLAREL